MRQKYTETGRNIERQGDRETGRPGDRDTETKAEAERQRDKGIENQRSTETQPCKDEIKKQSQKF
jgi:hypothetical protein